MNTFDSNNITEITLISLEEVKNGLAVDKLYHSWWLRPTSHTLGIPIVPEYRSLFKPGDVVGFPDESRGVRPALRLSEGPAIGELFKFAGYSWRVISENLALCSEVICLMPYRNREEPTPDFENSNIKRYLDLWLLRALALEKNNGKPFDAAFFELPCDRGLTRMETESLMDMIPQNEEYVFLEFIGCKGNKAMGIITLPTADLINYDRTFWSENGFIAYVGKLLDNEELRTETNLYRHICKHKEISFFLGDNHTHR